MGDADEGGAAGLEVARQPGDALDVEVVGGLVEDDQVGLADEELREGDAAALTAGQGRDDRVESLREAGQVESAEETGEHVADLGVARPLVVGEVADDLVPDGRLGVEGVVLREDAEAQAAAVGDAAGVGVLQLGEHPDEGGLAVAVTPDDTDPVPLGHAERYAVEQGTGAVHLADCLDIDQVDCHFAPDKGMDQSSSVVAAPGVPAACPGLRVPADHRRAPARPRSRRGRGPGRRLPVPLQPLTPSCGAPSSGAVAGTCGSPAEHGGDLAGPRDPALPPAAGRRRQEVAAGGERGVQSDESDRAERYEDLPAADAASAAPVPGARDVGGHGTTVPRRRGGRQRGRTQLPVSTSGCVSAGRPSRPAPGTS